MNRTVSVFGTVALVATVAFGLEDAARATREIVERTITRGIAILKDRETTDDQKMSAFDGLLEKNCHTELMSMLALGKTGWASLSAQQRGAFTKAFVDLIKRTYYGKLNQSDVTQVDVSYTDNTEVSATKRNVKTVMKNSGSDYHVDYKMAWRDDKWAIYDLEVEGISLIASYRSQFDDFLKSKTVAELIENLECKDQKFQMETVIP